MASLKHSAHPDPMTPPPEGPRMTAERETQLRANENLGYKMAREVFDELDAVRAELAHILQQQEQSGFRPVTPRRPTYTELEALLTRRDAEVREMRAALELIGSALCFNLDHNSGNFADGCPASGDKCIVCVARAALTPKDSPDGK